MNSIKLEKNISPLGENGLESSNLQIEHIQKLGNIIINNYENYDAFLITHGTDTMAFTASILVLAVI